LPYSSDRIGIAAENFRRKRTWIIDSALACLGAAEAIKTFSPFVLHFQFLEDGQTNLPPEPLARIFCSLKENVRLVIKCRDFFFGHGVTSTGGREMLFDLIKIHRFVN